MPQAFFSFTSLSVNISSTEKRHAGICCEISRMEFLTSSIINILCSFLVPLHLPRNRSPKRAMKSIGKYSYLLLYTFYILVRCFLRRVLHLCWSVTFTTIYRSGAFNWIRTRAARRPGTFFSALSRFCLQAQQLVFHSTTFLITQLSV